MANAPYATNDQMSPGARAAALAGTRQMIHDDEFSALVALLVDCGAVPRNVMGAVLDRLAEQMLAKARGEMESDALVYPAELFDRARSLRAMAGGLAGPQNGCGATAQ